MSVFYFFVILYVLLTLFHILTLMLILNTTMTPTYLIYSSQIFKNIPVGLSIQFDFITM